MNKEPRLFLTSMSSESDSENYVEMLEPLLPFLSGVIWSLCDVSPSSPAARYLESVKGEGKIIHRPWCPGRHFVPMNDTLWSGRMEEGDFFIQNDLLERPKPEFVSRIKSGIVPMMREADVGAIYFYGKAFLVKFNETLEYAGSPHWFLKNTEGRVIEWSAIEPDEKKVRENVRSLKRNSSNHSWTTHYASYWLYPQGSNHALLGLEKRPGDLSQNFNEREARRLEFRKELRKRGFPMTLDGLKALLTAPLDETLKRHLREEKTLSDVYHFWHGREHLLKDTHLPSDAVSIDEYC